MTNREFKHALIALGWTHADAAREFELSLRTITRYVVGKEGGKIPRSVELAIKSYLLTRGAGRRR